MTRVALAVGVAVVAGLSGCASPAKLVSKDMQNGVGVVAIPDNTDVWPTYYKRSAMALIAKEVGPGAELVDVQRVVVGQRTNNNQQIQNEQTFNRSNPFLPADKQTVQNTTTTTDVTEYHLVFRFRPGSGAMPQGAVQQTQYRPGTQGGPVRPAGGIVPQTNPAIVPANGSPTTYGYYPSSPGAPGTCPDGRCSIP